MTAVMDPTTKPDEALHDDDGNKVPTEGPVTEPTTPEKLKFEVGGDLGVIEAATEADAMRVYKRLVRAQALNAQAEQGWCASGTNERLVRLGVRKIGEGVSIKVEATVKRKVYIKVDAETKEEALAMIEAGEADVLATVKTHIGREFEVLDLAVASPNEKGRIYAVEEDDDTHIEVREHDAGQCYEYDPDGSGYHCTRTPGHDGNHAAGNSRRILRVWD